MFLPAGYPDSVSEDYLAFQFWDTIQAVCSYLRGVLATQSVLQSVGVGNDKATPLAAALQWVLRDGSGMIGGLTFAYFVGPKFDVNVKRWRLFADVINDVGLTLDMLAPFFPSLVTEVLCVSSVCKTMCGVAAGATRSSLMTHFAKRDNMADCAAKEGSQETAVKLFGLVFGMYFANAVNSSQYAIWVAFLTLTLVHVFANYNAVSGLCIPTVNQQRGLILIQRFMNSAGTGTSSAGKKELAAADHANRVRYEPCTMRLLWLSYRVCIKRWALLVSMRSTVLHSKREPAGADLLRPEAADQQDRHGLPGLQREAVEPGPRLPAAALLGRAVPALSRR